MTLRQIHYSMQPYSAPRRTGRDPPVTPRCGICDTRALRVWYPLPLEEKWHPFKNWNSMSIEFVLVLSLVTVGLLVFRLLAFKDNRRRGK